MEFWKSVFSKFGDQSWGRIAASALLLTGLAWITRLILQMTNPDQYDKLTAVAIFLGALITSVSALYGISKGLDTVQKIKGAGDDTANKDSK